MLVTNGEPYFLRETSFISSVNGRPRMRYSWTVLGPDNVPILNETCIGPGQGRRICDALNHAYLEGQQQGGRTAVVSGGTACASP